MGRKISILIVDAEMAKHTSLAEVSQFDIVLQGRPNQAPADAPTYEVIKNKWGDRNTNVNGNDVETFLDACGVRSAT